MYLIYHKICLVLTFIILDLAPPKNVVLNVTLVDNGGIIDRNVEFVLEGASRKGSMYGHIRRVTALNGVVAITEDRAVVKKNNYFRIAYVVSPNIWEADPVFREVPKTAFDEDAPNELLVMTFHLRKKNKVGSTSEIDLVRGLQQQLKKMSEERDRLVDMKRLQNVTDSMKAVLDKAIRLLKDSIDDKLKLVKSHFADSLATELNSFKEDLLNLRGVLTPDNVGNAFIFPDTRTRIEKHVDAYGHSRNILAKRRDSKWSYIYELWGKDEGIRLTTELAKVYSFALDTINTTYLLPLNERVFDRIDDVGTGKKPRLGTQSRAVREMKIAARPLKRKTDRFVELSNSFLDQFRMNK